MAVGRIAEGHLAAGGTFGRAAVTPHEIGRVVIQDFAEPGEPFLLGAAVEPLEVAVGFQHRLLHQIRGVDLPPQPGFDLRSGDEAQVRAAQLEEPLPAFGVAPPRPFDQSRISHGIVVAHRKQSNSGRRKTPGERRGDATGLILLGCPIPRGEDERTEEKAAPPRIARRDAVF